MTAPKLKPCLCGHTHITIGKGPVKSIVVACNAPSCYVMVRANNEEKAVKIWEEMRRPPLHCTYCGDPKVLQCSNCGDDSNA